MLNNGELYFTRIFNCVTKYLPKKLPVLGRVKSLKIEGGVESVQLKEKLYECHYTNGNLFRIQINGDLERPTAIEIVTSSDVNTENPVYTSNIFYFVNGQLSKSVEVASRDSKFKKFLKRDYRSYSNGYIADEVITSFTDDGCVGDLYHLDENTNLLYYQRFILEAGKKKEVLSKVGILDLDENRLPKADKIISYSSIDKVFKPIYDNGLNLAEIIKSSVNQRDVNANDKARS